jgi:hypothetical protein
MTKIFKRQYDFAKIDLVDNEILPFTNILDKGYRVNLPAWRAGRQEVIQPIFAKSDRKYSGVDTIHTVDVATTRSGNKRSVNLCKQAGYIQWGLHSHSKASMMSG